MPTSHHIQMLRFVGGLSSTGAVIFAVLLAGAIWGIVFYLGRKRWGLAAAVGLIPAIIAFLVVINLGDPALTLSLAVALSLAAFGLYMLEARRHNAVGVILGLFRAAAVFLIVLMLTEPTWHEEHTEGRKTRVMVFVDASKSMSVADDQMDLGRKLLYVENRGWVSPGAVDMSLMTAAAHIAEGRRIVAVALDTTRRVDEMRTTAQKAAAEFKAAIDVLTSAHNETGKTETPRAMADRYKSTLLDPANALASSASQAMAMRPRNYLVAMAEGAARAENELGLAFRASVDEQFKNGNGALKTAIERFDSLSRWKRVEASLLTGDDRLLARLARSHNTELWTLQGHAAQRLWSHDQTETIPATLDAEPNGKDTDLADGIRDEATSADTAAGDEERIAVVLFSDGLHNEGGNPIQTARVLGARGVPLYTIGVGASSAPEDMAVIRVEGPNSAYVEDRVRGKVVFKDDMPAGRPFTLRLEHKGKVVWEKQLVTQKSHLRSEEFDFPIKDLVASEMSNKDPDVEIVSLPLALKATIPPIVGEKEKDNNAADLLVRAVTKKRKMLLVDGRPRWEWRYLKNLFERDEQWDMNALVGGVIENDPPWPRSDVKGSYPRDQAALNKYDLVIFGEVPRSRIADTELAQLEQFVTVRGGGLIVMDGERGHLRRYATTPLAKLLPIEWTKPPGVGDRATRLHLTDAGAALGPLALASGRAENLTIWSSLMEPHWLAPVKALPGSEVLLEANVGGAMVPAMVFHKDGAGRVVYLASDETWRFRHEVADLYHSKLWNQLCEWMMEKPYAVRDRFVMLDVSQTNYLPGQTAEVRVRIEDANHKPMLSAKATAELYRDGKKAGTVELTPDESGSGVYRGVSGQLPDGLYEVGVKVQGLPDTAMKARTKFTVKPTDPTGEMANLICDEDLLQKMATLSGGQYLREEDAQRLEKILEPLSNEKTIAHDTSLWNNGWWFVPVLLLLAGEWFIRKRIGLM